MSIKNYIHTCLSQIFLISALVTPIFAADNETTPTTKQSTPWESLFDGKTLSGWKGDPKIWRVEDGAIVGETTPENPIKKNTFLIWHEELSDFRLELEIKLENGNSGIQYRSEQIDDNFALKGYQADLEAGDRHSGIFYEEKGRGILAKRGEKITIHEDGKKQLDKTLGDSAELNKKILKNDWNHYTIIARGHHFVHIINGKTMVEVDDHDAQHFRSQGLLGIQVHVGKPMKVSVRNIRVQRLMKE